MKKRLAGQLVVTWLQDQLNCVDIYFHCLTLVNCLICSFQTIDGHHWRSAITKHMDLHLKLKVKVTKLQVTEIIPKFFFDQEAVEHLLNVSHTTEGSHLKQTSKPNRLLFRSEPGVAHE